MLAPHSNLSRIVLLISALISKCSGDANANANADAGDIKFDANADAGDIKFDAKLDALSSHLLGPQLPVMVQPIDGYSLNETYFKPSFKLEYFVSSEYKGSAQLRRITLKHDDYPYVYLDPIEVVLTEPVVCRPDAKAGHNTSLTLNFSTMKYFEIAQKYWNPSPDDPMHFVVEGPHCFEAGGDRSVYLSSGIKFNVEEKRIDIQAEPLHAHVASANHWVSDWSAEAYTLDDGHVVVPRMSASHLHKRNFPDLHQSMQHTFKDVQWEPRHQFLMDEKSKAAKYFRVPSINVTCVNCRTKGAIAFTFLLDFDLRPHHHRNASCDGPKKRSQRSKKAAAFLDKHHRLQSKVAVNIEAERIARHQEVHADLRKRQEPLPPAFEWLSCPESDPTYPVCHDEKIVSPVPKDCSKAQNLLLDPPHIVVEALKCTGQSIIGHPSCWHDFSQDASQFKDFADYIGAFIRAHVHNFEIKVEVTEDLDLRLQLEILTTLEVGVWFDVDIFPYDVLNPAHNVAHPPFIDCNFGWFAVIGGTPSFRQNVGGKPLHGEKKDELPIGKQGRAYNQNGRNKMGTEDAKKRGTSALGGLGLITFDLVPLTFSSSLKVSTTLNITSPGFEVKISKGAMVMRPLHDDRSQRYQNNIKVETKYLNAALEIGGDSQMVLSHRLGPRIKFHLFPVASVSPIPIGGPTGLDFISKDMQSSGLGLGDPLSFGVFFQPLRVDFIVSEAPPNDKDCAAKKGPFNNGGLKFEVVFRSGIDAYAQSFAFRIDTSYIKVLQHTDVASEAHNGLWISKRVLVLCHEWSTKGSLADHVNAIIKKLLDAMQEPIAKWFDALGPKLSAAPFNGSNSEPFRDWSSHKNNLDYFHWYSSVVGPNQLQGLCDEICDPESTYYIPEGITQGIYDAYQQWYQANGGKGNVSAVGVVNASQLLDEAYQYNSSTVIIPTSTIFTPAPPFTDTMLPPEWQWSSGTTTSAGSQPSSIYHDPALSPEWQEPESTISPASGKPLQTTSIYHDPELPPEWQEPESTKTSASSKPLQTTTSGSSSTPLTATRIAGHAKRGFAQVPVSTGAA